MDTDRNKEFFDAIRGALTQSRFYHSLNVAYEAKQLAALYGADAEKAFTAGLLHDIMKDKRRAEQKEYIEQNGVVLTKTELVTPRTWHQLAGALYLANALHVTDAEILDAVRFHTTGRAGMTLLEKVIYIADYISADRHYPGVDRMREKAYRNLDEAMLEGLQFTIIENVQQALPVHEDSIAAYNDIAAFMKGKKSCSQNKF